MRYSYLLDTQVVIWLDGAPHKIPAQIRQALGRGTQLFFSAASAWEAAIKRANGKLQLAAPFTVIAAQLQLTEIAVSAKHGEAAGELPLHHKDPFDRLLVAQSQVESLILVSSDPELRQYDVDLLLI